MPGRRHNTHMDTKTPLTHAQRVALYVKIIQQNLLPKSPLTDFNVALMRNNARSQAEMDALNAALLQLGWQK